MRSSRAVIPMPAPRRPAGRVALLWSVRLPNGLWIFTFDWCDMFFNTRLKAVSRRRVVNIM